MNNITREEIELRHRIFVDCAVNPLSTYYNDKVNAYERASGQANLIRGFLAFIAGIASVIVGTFAPEPAKAPSVAIIILILIAIIAPALASAFSTLEDLYQWERRRKVVSSALESLLVANALDPIEDFSDAVYITSLTDRVSATLAVMRDEASQYGQGQEAKPPQTEAFLKRAEALSQQIAAAAPGVSIGDAQPAPI